MPHYSESRCTCCGLLADKARLTIKRATFSHMVNPSKVTRSRVVSWLCNRCLEKDVEYNLPAYRGPGHTSPALERVRADTEKES